MSIPLPHDVLDIVGPEARLVENASLLLDKYCSHKNWPNAGDDAMPMDSLKRVVRVLRRGNPATEEIKELRRNSTDVLASQFLATGQACEVIATTASRLAIGLSDGIIQNGGITLDRLTGLPTLRGSAVKGVARNAALWKIRNNPDQAEKARLTTLFLKTFGFLEGDLARGSSLSEQLGCDLRSIADGDAAGMVSFLAALPLENADLEIDITNVHTAEYYTRRGQAGNPALLREERPKLNFFPTVASGACFCFLLSLTPRGRSESEASAILEYARESLHDALSIHGIGAKTGAGYGWFVIDRETAGKRERDRVNKVKDNKDKGIRSKLLPDPSLYEGFSNLTPQQTRALVNPFQYDLRFWKKDGPEADEVYRLSVFRYFTEEKTELYLSEKENPKSRFLKGLANLAEHFSLTLP